MVEDPSLSLATEKSVALIVVGDPMQATAHVDLESHCAEQGIDFSVILVLHLFGGFIIGPAIISFWSASDASIRLW